MKLPSTLIVLLTLITSCFGSSEAEYRSLFDAFQAAEKSQDWRTQATMLPPEDLERLKKTALLSYDQAKKRMEEDGQVSSVVFSTFADRLKIEESTPEEIFMAIRQTTSMPMEMVEKMPEIRFSKIRSEDGKVFIETVTAMPGTDREVTVDFEVIDVDGKRYLRIPSLLQMIIDDGQNPNK